jgi:hypothetical protein
MAGQARMIRTRIVISGRVQGVYFRASARDVAMTMHAHPTLLETIGEAAEAYYGMSVHQAPPKKEAAKV